MFLHVIRAEYLRDYRLHLWFNDGFDGEIDLNNELTGPIFEPLRDLAQFSRFQLEGHTVTWANGADFAPEFLRQRTRVLSTA